MTLEQAQDFLDETLALYALIADLDDAALEMKTAFKAWSINDVVAHLYYFNIMADQSLSDKDAFRASLTNVIEQMGGGVSMRELAKTGLAPLWGTQLREAWHDYAISMAKRFAAADPSERLQWFGPEMSVRSSITARLMETWAHGQAVYDALGVRRDDEDRIRNIALLGVKTYGWTFMNRGLTPPDPMPFVDLIAPSGARWRFGDPDDHQRIEGDATAFCQVVTQTRNIEDTNLVVTGGNARQWMAIAQCFAGAPENPPAPGTRGPIAPIQH